MAWRDRFGMEKTWQVSGAYANWTLTVTIEPPDHETEYRDDWREEPLTRLHLHFCDVVNLLELGREVQKARTYGLSHS